jgi:hypothetical protein
VQTRLVHGAMMNDEYFKQQAARVRALADKADPFTRKRLLDLAERYDAKVGRPSRATRQLRLPDSGQASASDNATEPPPAVTPPR